MMTVNVATAGSYASATYLPLRLSKARSSGYRPARSWHAVLGIHDGHVHGQFRTITELHQIVFE